MQLTDEGTPVAEIGEGDRFEHWLYGLVVVLYRRDVTSNNGKPLVRLGLMAALGEVADDWRPNARIHVLED